VYLFQSTSSRYFAQSSTLNSSRNGVNRTVSWHAAEPIQLTGEPQIIPKWGDDTVDNMCRNFSQSDCATVSAAGSTMPVSISFNVWARNSVGRVPLTTARWWS